MADIKSENTKLTQEQKDELLYSDDKIDVTTFKCPNCGGEAVFDPSKQKMRCLYCDSLFEIQNEGKAGERDLGELLEQGTVWSYAEVYQCESCGAKEILEKQEVSMKCPFCGTSNIIKTDELPGLKPQGITPFKITSEQVETIAVKWAKKKLYAPRSFKKSVKAENINGIYNPVFTFDASTRSSYNGKLGKNYTTTRYVNGKMVAETHTRYFMVSGVQDCVFDDLLVQASYNVPITRIREIEPFPTNKAVEYRTEYLRGYSASTYSKSGKECWSECKSVMSNAIERQILKKYDYDIKVYLNVDTKYFNQHYKYVLVPVYVGHYKYKQKLYNFYVNGHNGRIAGKTPVSAVKVSLTVLFILLLIGGFIFLAIYFDLFS